MSVSTFSLTKVSGAYGGSGIFARSLRPKYQGLEQADSFILDAHKWLFTPFDCCAPLCLDPELARATLASLHSDASLKLVREALARTE